MNIYKIVIFILLLSIIYMTNVFPCSIVKQRPVRFDSTTYVFIGKVVGYVGPIRSDSLNEIFLGLMVDVVDKTFLPRTPLKHFEIIIYALRSDCQFTCFPETLLHARYPVGCNVRIVARETKYFIRDNKSDNIKLDINPFEDASLSVNITDIPELCSSSKFEYDYRNIWGKVEIFINKWKHEFPQYEESTLYDSDVYLVDYEIQKDLFKLSSSDNDIQNKKILSRISYFYKDISIYSKLVKRYIKDDEIRKELIKACPVWK